ncbi:hypothetical protein BDN72DRAFT_809354 [Pluteus cervinus]|uniref:Uncharacterized protein n=1 Tax=Pluteus cervinus TaxID=181527 RepID=A0ACD3BDS2_9AGAR|nr:hypothetical protein BDN72DRAFT_809354 [Pluteus cervinus]
MSDSGFQRRQPPSPLVFPPETILSPIPLQAHRSTATTASTTTSHGSGSNTVSMPFVRRHVTRRLKAAKAECDKELQRVTNNITTFFEERLREGDYEDRESRDRDRDREREMHLGDTEPLRDAFVFHPEFGTALQTDESSSDGGYEAEVEYNHRHSRQRAYPDDDPRPRPHTPTLTHSSSSPALHAASSASSMSPASLRRQSTLLSDKPLASSFSSSAITPSPASSSVVLPEAPLTRKTSTSTPWSSQGLPSRRLSRSIHMSSRPPTSHSGQSSRSTSRSRSPMPPLASHTTFSDYASSTGSTSNRRSSRILVDDPIDPIMSALYELTSVATDISDMSVPQLTAQPKICEALVQRVQNIGKAWDDHPDWHGRNWYVQVLLAVASLSRVVEWWEAEKQFWNFDDNEDEQDEPLMFVTKPADEPHSSSHRDEGELDGFRLDDENQLRATRPAAQPRKSRDEHTKDLSVTGTLRPGHEVHARVPSSSAKAIETAESARVLATERLRLQAETAQNQNIVMELSLDGDHFIWVNHAWRGVVGTEPEELSGTRISTLLARSDWGVFKEATKRLQEDDSHTVEVRFQLRVRAPEDREQDVLFQLMEGKGMLMIDREDGQPSHTMWVVKPMAHPHLEHESPSIAFDADDAAPQPAASADLHRGDSTLMEPPTPLPFTQPISTNPILCRICESQIPQWYFEKHSETCAETHRLEAEIIECNESISELQNTIRELASALDRTSPGGVAEYRGMPIFTPSSPIVSSPLQLFRANKMQRFGVKKMQKRLLDQLEDILQVASEVAIPALKEDESKEPIERQRLLSPSSERKVSQIRNWIKPATEDGALSQLLQDAERVMRQKVDNVVRMQNTIRYAEKIWHEWEEKIAEELGDDDSESDDEDLHLNNRETQPIKEEAGEVDDHSSTTSEYAFNGETDPTPIPAVSPIPTPVPGEPRPVSVPIPIRPHGLPTRSSTPSSVSSPLALAAPIVASASTEEAPPPMTLDEMAVPLTIKTRKSIQSMLEPKFIITPPTSPLVSAKDSSPSLSREPSTRRGHRRHSTVNPVMSPSGPLSPRQTSVAPLTRSSPTSIKDFDIIKPISKGAFGSVFLAKKKATGDYYAIKVLKKADMIAKNQITNVKAERMILMKQAESPFVAKLYFTFQSKDNLYLVMEYLNGGDCAALIKSLGCLSEEWAKNYIAEVVLGLDYLHQRGIVHRDLKPDNLLIDQHGHLKLTDFGLSRIGLLGRQTREPQLGRPHTHYKSRSRPPSMDSAYLSSPLIYPDPNGGPSYFTQQRNPTKFGQSPHFPTPDDVGESSGSDSIPALRRKQTESPLQSFATELANDLRSHSNSGGGTPPGEQKFVGTPDYLAPETILGLRGDDAAVDWWALGVITYEFLYGIPPFHAETPEKVFENILSGHIDWHEDWVEYSEEAHDFMRRLMTLDPTERLGANGAEEVKAHPFFAGIDWDKVTSSEAAFIPQVSDPESTDYFDPRGAMLQLFHEDELVAVTGKPDTDSPDLGAAMPPPSLPVPINREPSTSGNSTEFGAFSFKNLGVLKQANDDVIRKLRTDQMTPLHHALSEPSGLHQRKRSISQRLKKPPHVVTNMDKSTTSTNPPSPATSTSSIASSPSRTSLPPPTPGSGSGNAHSRKPSEFGAVERFKQSHLDNAERRNSLPSRLRTASFSSVGEGSGSETWTSSLGHGSQHGSHQEASTPPSSVHSIDLRKGPDPTDRAVTCLLAEDNPITAKIIETLLIRLGCRCVVVADGSEAISVAMGDIKFDCILMDLHMPVLDGEGAARYIKSTNNKNTNTPIIAVSAYSGIDPNETSNVFAASLSKPLQKADLLAVMRQLGFKTSALQGGGPSATHKVTAPHTTTALTVS